MHACDPGAPVIEGRARAPMASTQLPILMLPASASCNTRDRQNQRHAHARKLYNGSTLFRVPRTVDMQARFYYLPEGLGLQRVKLALISARVLEGSAATSAQSDVWAD